MTTVPIDCVCLPISPSITRVSTRSRLPRAQVAEIRWSKSPGTPASWLGRIADITAAPPTPSFHRSQCASLRAQLQRSARLLLPTSGRWLMSLIELVFRDRSVNTTHEGAEGLLTKPVCSGLCLKWSYSNLVPQCGIIVESFWRQQLSKC